MFNMSGKFLRDLWTLTRPYWFSEDRWVGRGLLAANLGLNLGLVYLNVLFNDWYRLFYDSLQNKDLPEFYHQLLRFTYLAIFYILIGVYQIYLRQMLQIRWRKWLTGRYLSDWLAGNTYYRMQLTDPGTDNPDQRISEDLRLFVEQTLRLSLDFISSVVTLFSFVTILWTISGPLTVPIWGGVTIPGYMVWAALVYAIVGTSLTHVIGVPLVRLRYDQQHFEADFRFSLVRFRENAEGIALYGGEHDEEQTLKRHFEAIVANWWRIMKRTRDLTWFTATYSQLAVIFPFVVGAPRYFTGAIQLGTLVQISSSFGQVQSALSWFVDAYTSLAEWRATVDRLTGFELAMARARARAVEQAIVRDTSPGPEIALDHVALTLPQGETLVDGLDLALKPQQPVMFAGPSGSGKSTLFRALAGIWPFGRGAIRIPRGARALFLPQKPYIPLGKLRAVVCYPNPPVDDATLREALDAVGLGPLGARLDEEQNWTLQLSPGEQQRLAVARALIGKPDWLFLDEATSALDETIEEELYRLLRERLPGTTLVSIGHRTTLRRYHDRLLTLVREGRTARLVDAVGAQA
jgi:putative ATP-binding cassette transporter